MSRYLSERLQALAPYVPGEQPKVKLNKLNTNESPFPPAPGVREAVAEAATNLQLYNDLSAAKLTGLLAKTYGLKENQITVSNGSDEILAFAFQAFGGHGLIFPDITYGFYPVWANLFRLDAKTVPLDKDFNVDIADYQGNDRCIVLANPNAPTGKALPLSALREIAEKNPDQVVIVDEAYVDFGAESALALVPEFDNVLVVRTFSKSRQLAGARLGFAMGNAALIDDLNRVRFSFHPYNVNTLTQAAGAAALEQPKYFEACRQTIMETRAWTAEQLKVLGFTVLDSKANFLFAAAPGRNGAEYQKALREKNILVRYFDLPRIRDFTRITIGTKAQMEQLIQATKEILA
ncbi:MAG: histidinol-phosphate transaminase [Clostridia bacterium]|nr:histidinol-phosphate transaminase [Clostridia bacterium]MBR0408562.1 histidinol-phosphate transaminase [Clostridia bacterium]